MPIYTCQCACGRKETIFRHVSKRDENLPTCCQGVMQRIVEAPAVQTDLPGYQSPIDGRWIEGRRARMEDLKRSNCRPWEGMEAEKKEAERRANEVDHKFERVIEQGVADVYNGMSAEHQRALAQL
ncbi:hypothetical protein [Ralstonia sp. 3N]|uniref:hypothetical protein n=1 Tax=Ralstonia sp. 3N TaxID=2675750 RepID=UPI001C12D642|nr:hypothetical protein [Ralstonia sp. 3N]